MVSNVYGNSQKGHSLNTWLDFLRCRFRLYLEVICSLWWEPSIQLKVWNLKDNLFSHTEPRSRRWRKGNAIMNATGVLCRMTLPAVSIITSPLCDTDSPELYLPFFGFPFCKCTWYLFWHLWYILMLPFLNSKTTIMASKTLLFSGVLSRVDDYVVVMTSYTIVKQKVPYRKEPDNKPEWSWYHVGHTAYDHLYCWRWISLDCQRLHQQWEIFNVNRRGTANTFFTCRGLHSRFQFD